MLTIPEIAAAEVEKNMLKEDADEDQSRSIFIAGSKSVGKTTALHGFLDKSETVRETLALEYSFGRKTKQKQSIEKIICHIWEYGGKLELLKEVMTCVPRQGHLTVVLMLDLSKPRRLWPVLEIGFRAIGELTNGKSKAPTTVVFVGGKYDIFKNFDSDTKKNITITIRSLAMIYNAYVVFYSSEDQTLAKRLKQVFHYFGFGSGNFPKDKSVSISKPLIICQGADSWESIGTADCDIESVKSTHLRLFPSELDDCVPATGGRPAPPLSHPEPVLDCIKKKKYEEMIEIADIATIDYLKSFQ